MDHIYIDHLKTYTRVAISPFRNVLGVLILIGKLFICYGFHLPSFYSISQTRTVRF